MQMKTSDKNGRIEKQLAFCQGGVLSWRFLALFFMACCVAFDAIQYLVPLDNGTPLLYVFYPASLIVFARLLYDCRYVKYPEIRFLLIYILWMCASVVLNRSRAHIVDSYSWFASVCVTSFLCFSLPYAFTKEGASRVLTILAAASLAAVTVLSAVGLIAVLVKNAAERMPTLFSGFGFYGGRLTLDSNPNRSAPYCAVAVVLTGYLLVRMKKALPRILVSIGGAICFAALALTNSLTAIIAASVAVGFEVFILCNVWLPRIGFMKKTRALLRVVLCVVMMCIAVVVCYKGTGLVRTAYSAYAARANYMAAAEAPEVEKEQQPSAALPQQTESAIVLPTRSITDMESVNIRMDIWIRVLKGLTQNPRILAFGTGPEMAGELMLPYFPEGWSVAIFHNSLLGAFVSFGIPGLLLTVGFLLIVALAAIKFSFGSLTSVDTLAVRMLPAMLLYTLMNSMMEDFMFVNGCVNIVWIWFMFSAGFILRFLKSDAAPGAETAKDDGLIL